MKPVKKLPIIAMKTDDFLQTDMYSTECRTVWIKKGFVYGLSSFFDSFSVQSSNWKQGELSLNRERFGFSCWLFYLPVLSVIVRLGGWHQSTLTAARWFLLIFATRFRMAGAIVYGGWQGMRAPLPFTGGIKGGGNTLRNNAFFFVSKMVVNNSG